MCLILSIVFKISTHIDKSLSEFTRWGSDSPDERAQASLSLQSLLEGKKRE